MTKAQSVNPCSVTLGQNSVPNQALNLSFRPKVLVKALSITIKPSKPDNNTAEKELEKSAFLELMKKFRP